MKTSYSWLKDYVDIKLSPEGLAEKLTMAGLEVTSLEKKAGDVIMEFEVTPNRPDCLSIIGIAREVAAITNKKLKIPKASVKATSKATAKVEIKDKDLCPRYTARIIEGVKVGPSPKWLVDKLEGMGIRPVNNVVDITNFCLFESAQPLHAFDYDKLTGKKIIVRRAKKNEKIVTIDGDERTLDTDTLVIADESNPVAVGGVMGSVNSEVTTSTTNILLESAYFDPISIRRTSRKLGLSSESSYRFERSVDMFGVRSTSDRAVSLILELCGGKAGSIKDAGKATIKSKEISLRLDRVNAILGNEISHSFIKKTLSLLGLGVEAGAKGKLKVIVPSFRQDLKTEEDLMEEIARIYGYDNFSSTIPPMVDQTRKQGFDFEACEEKRVIRDTIKDTLISSGVNEIITYSLISRALAEGVRGIDPSTIVNIKNPLSLEQEIMRPSLIPGILGVISRNLNRRIKNQKLFELGKIYIKDGPNYKEEERLIIALTGLASGFWLTKKKVDPFYVKGIVETLMEKLGITGLSIDIEKAFLRQANRDAAVKIGAEQIGFLEGVSKDLLAKFSIKTDVVICEIEIPKVIKAAKLKKRFSEIAKYPSATRDLSIVVDESILRERVERAIKDSGGELVKKVELSSQYRGEQIPTGKKGLHYAIEYHGKDRTLTDREVNKLHSKIRDTLTTQLGAQLR